MLSISRLRFVFNVELILIFGIIISLLIFAACVWMRKNENVQLALAHRQKNLELNKLRETLIKIANKIDSKKRPIKDIKPLLEEITIEKGDDDWIRSYTGGVQYQINLSTQKWLSVDKYRNEIAIFCPKGIRIGKNIDYLAITFGGEGRILKTPPEW